MIRPHLKPMRALRLLAPFTLALVAVACDDDDVVEPVNEEEVITTVTITFTAPGGETSVLTFSDPDGEGGDDGTTTGDTLAANTEYAMSAAFLNEAEDPAEDITVEIREEDEEHQVFYLPSAGLNLTVVATDEDEDSNPVGLLATATTGDASSGTLGVVLRHEPAKDADGVADGDIANAGGETDVEIDFPVVIE